MTPKPIAEAPRDGTVIVGLRRREVLTTGRKYWDGSTMFWSRDLMECWRYTGLIGGEVRKGCEPTHFLPVDGANDV